MGIVMTDIPKMMVKAVSVRREDIARAKQFVLADAYPAVEGIADRWLKEHKLETPNAINYMADEAEELVLRTARAYSLRMALYQAVWELITAGLVVPVGPAEVWKPNLGYHTPHGSGGLPVGDISYPFVTQIHRVTLADGVPTDSDILLRGIDCSTLHPGIREAIDQSLGCFRRGLCMPATAMLAAAAEATWTECGVKVAAKLSNAKLDSVVNDPYASISKKVTETRKAIEAADGKALLKTADRSIADVVNAELWTTALRERRNALHWDKAKSFVADHSETGTLLIAAPLHIGTLEAVRAAC